MTFLSEYGLFLLKSLTLVFTTLLLVGGLISLGRKTENKFNIRKLNDEWEHIQQRMHKTVFGKKQKKQKRQTLPSLYVIDFNGDIKASQVESLRAEISAILSIATPQDEVLLCIESPGGSVNGYGLAAAQLQRLRDHGIPLTVCIDKIAASGGYLMACIAKRIIAAPFAIIGSIGVVAQVPNFHRLLRKKDIDVELLTAGEYKRTLTLFAENTEKGRKKFQEDLEEIHATFKEHVLKNRPQLNIDEVSTGEHWLARDALALGLVDALQTSDDYLHTKMRTHHVYAIQMQTKQSWMSKLLKPAMALLHPWA